MTRPCRPSSDGDRTVPIRQVPHRHPQSVRSAARTVPTQACAGAWKPPRFSFNANLSRKNAAAHQAEGALQGRYLRR